MDRAEELSEIEDLPGAGRIADYRRGSGQRVLAGQAGLVFADEGEIWFLRPPRVGCDLHLWAATKAAANALKLRIRVRTVDSASVHVPNSRHYIGCAEDIDLVAEMGDPWRTATLQNPACMKLHRWYRDNGWAIGEPSGRPGLILGPVRSRYNPTRINHATHLHVSVARPLTPGDMAEDPFGDEREDEEICLGCDAEEALIAA